MKTYEEAVKLFMLPHGSSETTIRELQEQIYSKYGDLSREVFEGENTKVLIKEILLHTTTALVTAAILGGDPTKAIKEMLEVALMNGIIIGMEMEKNDSI